METLQEKCINVLSRNFHKKPIACANSQLKPELLQKIHEGLCPDLDPFGLARHVVSERYWQRCLEQQQQHVFALSTTAKSSVLQSALQQVLEDDDEERMECIDLDTIVEHIFALRLTKISLNVDLSKTFTSLKNLTSLEIELGPSGMSVDEARILGKALTSVEYLTSLSMTNCCLSDDSIRAMKDGMNSSSTGSPPLRLPRGLISLDVSDNKLTAGGLGLLFDMLLPLDEDGNNIRPSVLSSFVAANNCIDEEGGRFLATDVLPVCTSLTHLNVKLNEMGDVGGEMVLNALRDHNNGSSCGGSHLQEINLAGNGLASKTAESLTELLRSTGNNIASLSFIDLSLNNLSSEDIARVLSAVEGNSGGRRGATLLHLDLQENSGLDKEAGRSNQSDVFRIMERDCGVRVFL